MKSLFSFLILAIFSLGFLHAKTVYVKADLPNGVRVTSKYPCPEKKCHILVAPVGSIQFKRAKSYVNQLSPKFVAKLMVAEDCDFVNVKIEAPGYRIHKSSRPIVKTGDKYVVDLSAVQLEGIVLPKISNVILSRHTQTGSLKYQIWLSNPTDGDYTFTQLELLLAINYDFGSAGITGSNVSDLTYQLKDDLHITSRGATIDVVELQNNPEYLVSCVGDINFFKNRGVIEIQIGIETNLTIASGESSSIQLELPPKINLIDFNNEVNLAFLKSAELEVLKLDLERVKYTVIKLKSAENDIPKIVYKK